MESTESKRDSEFESWFTTPRSPQWKLAASLLWVFACIAIAGLTIWAMASSTQGSVQGMSEADKQQLANQFGKLTTSMASLLGIAIVVGLWVIAKRPRLQPLRSTVAGTYDIMPLESNRSGKAAGSSASHADDYDHSIQADHYIIRTSPPEPTDKGRMIDAVLKSNGYIRGVATVDYRIDPAAWNEAYLKGLLLAYRKNHPIDKARTRTHKFNGGATGTMVAVFHAGQS